MILTEDNQEIFNNDNIFKKVYKQNNKTIPCNSDFSLFFTLREFLHGRLSEAFLLRCTIINCPNYINERYLTIDLSPEKNYEKICKNIVRDINLAETIISLNKKLDRIDKIEVLRFIRWCKSANNIFEKINNIEYETELKKKIII